MNNDTATTENPRLNFALRAMESTQERLAEAATTANTDTLMSLVHELARDEIFVALENRVSHCAEYHDGDLELSRKKIVKSTLNEIVLSGADDRWSGRGNDLQRVKFDAKRAWVENFMNL